jgi:photosystem II stability/assembly factor-like uncharacterized protein
LYTADGGATWRKQESGTPRWLYGVAFADARNGWAVGEEGLILNTTDGGANWAVQISGVPSHLLSVHAVNARRVLVVGMNGFIVQTNDGGKHWQRDTSGTTTPLRGVFARSDQAWAVGRAGAILRYAGTGGEFRTVFGSK